MAIQPTLADGESFVPGRSIEKARELLAAAEKAGLPAGSVRTASHGYIVPSELIHGEGKRKASDAAEGEKSEGEQFDPTTATVDEVKEYLAGADEAEKARVIGIEQATDKPRKGVLDLAAPEGE